MTERHSLNVPTTRVGRGSSLPFCGSTVDAVACGVAFGLFLLLVVLGYLGVLLDADLATARLEDPAVGRLIDAAFPSVALVWSPEACVLYGAIAALLLWGAGLRRWAPAPLAFLVLVPLEIVAKTAFLRPPMPGLLKPWPSYPLVNPELAGGFLSGSAIRAGFLCLFLALVLWRQGGALERFAAAGLVALAALTAFLRVYGRYHWLSSELSGQALGIALAFLVAPLVADRLRAARLRTATVGRKL